VKTLKGKLSRTRSFASTGWEQICDVPGQTYLRRQLRHVLSIPND